MTVETRHGHPSADIVRAYAAGALPPAEYERIGSHIQSCADCMEQVRRIEQRGTLFQRPTLALPRYRRHAPDLVELAPVPEELVITRLTPRDLAGSLEPYDDLREQEWLQHDLPDTWALDQRLGRDLVFAAATELPSGELDPVALLSGRYSNALAPRWSDLEAEADGESTPRSVSFYEIIVAERLRHRDVGLRLFLQAASFCRCLYPRIAIRTISPIVGLRPWLASLLRVRLPDPSDARVEQSRRLRGLDASILDAVLRAAGDLDALRAHLPGDLMDWLGAVCRAPEQLHEVRDHGDARVRAELDRLLVTLARAYARGTWTCTDRPDIASLACYVSHFHLQLGAVEDGYHTFARHDLDSLFMTVSFRYPDEPARLANAASFARVRRGQPVPAYPLPPPHLQGRVAQARFTPACLG
jgi:hypothetical protein